MAVWEQDGRRVAARIGRIGVWTFHLDRVGADEARTFAREVEDLGFGALWVPESVGGKEAFAHLGLLLAASRRLVVASGIASIWARDPMAMASGARTLGEAEPGRLLLGVGVSHAPAVARRGSQYEKPYERMRAYLDAMHEAPYLAPEPAEPIPLVLAALGPRMLRLAAERSAGAHPYFVPVEHTRRARETLGGAPLLAVEQAAVLATDPAQARATARAHMERYLQSVNYANNLRRLGWTDADIGGGGSDRLVDAIVAWGDAEAVVRRVAEHHAAGADHVCLQVLPPPGSGVLADLRRLAPALREVLGTGGG